jgi:hypothetical protein
LLRGAAAGRQRPAIDRHEEDQLVWRCLAHVRFADCGFKSDRAKFENYTVPRFRICRSVTSTPQEEGDPGAILIFLTGYLAITRSSREYRAGLGAAMRLSTKV